MEEIISKQNHISTFEANVITDPFPEEYVIALLEKKTALPQLVEALANAEIDQYTPIQENKPMYAGEEPIPSSEENVKTATEEEPTSFHQSSVTEEATFVEIPLNETFVEKGYDLTNPFLSEEFGQDTFHVGTVGGKETERTIPDSGDNGIPYLDDQEFQKKSNDQNEEQLTFSKDVYGINDLKIKNMMNDTLNIQIPVFLGKYNIEICLNDVEIFAEKVKEIRGISNKVVLTTCEFIPSELSPVLDNGSCKALKGKLMIEGFIQQSIIYIVENQQTSNDVQNQSAFNQMNSMSLRKYNFGRYSNVIQTYPTTPAFKLKTKQGQHSERLIHSMSKTIPFSSVVEINHFLHPPLFGSIEEQSFTFQNNLDHQMANDTTQFMTTTYYPENIHGKLIYSKIHEDINFFKHEEKYRKNPRIKLKQFIVLELWIHLLQEQSVQVLIPQNEMN